MAKAKPRGVVGGVKAKWHKDAPAPKPPTPGASPEPFTTRVPARCPKCGTLVSFEDSEREARAYALRALKEGTHSREYCLKVQTGSLPEPVIPEKSKKAKKPKRGKR